MFELLATEANIAAELLERTASTMRVQEIVRLSMAPAFLLAGIGAIMNVMMSRLIWVAERIERYEARIDDQHSEREQQELEWLRHRRRLAQRAVMFSTSSALTISIVIVLLFVSAFIEPQIGTITALAWILTMLLLSTGLLLFARETIVAARGHRLASQQDQVE